MSNGRATGVVMLVLLIGACGSTTSTAAPRTTSPSAEIAGNAHTQPPLTRRTALLLRDTHGESAAACKLPGALPDPLPLPHASDKPLCLIWGETLLTGDDVTSATAHHDPAQPNGWCVTPTLTPAGASRLRAWMAERTKTFVLPIMSNGKLLTNTAMQPKYIRSGACWITTGGMTESAARDLAQQLS